MVTSVEMQLEKIFKSSSHMWNTLNYCSLLVVYVTYETAAVLENGQITYYEDLEKELVYTKT